MLGFKSLAGASATLTGIELIHMMRKRQASYVYNPHPSVAEQFENYRCGVKLSLHSFYAGIETCNGTQPSLPGHLDATPIMSFV